VSARQQELDAFENGKLAGISSPRLFPEMDRAGHRRRRRPRVSSFVYSTGRGEQGGVVELELGREGGRMGGGSGMEQWSASRLIQLGKSLLVTPLKSFRISHGHCQWDHKKE
jgi:hypothetical protein